MMKKIVFASLSGAAMLASTGAAQAQAAAQSVDAASGVQFTVGVQPCTLTAGLVDVGTFSAGSTGQAYVDREGVSKSGTVTLGTSAPHQLATVTCPSGTNWGLSIYGNKSDGSIDVLNPAGTRQFAVAAYRRTVDGLDQPGSMIDPNNITTGTGKGTPQIVTGNFLAWNPTASELDSKMMAGTYTGAAVATLVY